MSRTHCFFDERGEVVHYELAPEPERGLAAFALALTVETYDSIRRGGLRVRTGNLDGLVLRRALRGEELPHPDTFILVNDEMLDAITEAGLPAMPEKGRKR